MARTTDISRWLDALNLRDPADIYALYCSIDQEGSFASFRAKRAPSRALIVSGPEGVPNLVLASESAKTAALNLICKRHVHSRMDIGTWHAIQAKRSGD